MKTIEYRTIDKTAWGEGPWVTEPDKRQWLDPATGLPCLIVRGPHGALCGYVGVAAGHPLHRKGYDDVDVSVHGGLSFAEGCSHGDESKSICHMPDPGEPDDVHWFGFDCAHAGDWCPRPTGVPHSADYLKYCGLGAPTGWGGVIEYRDFPYVTRECGRLAQQLKAMETPA